jgi:acetolactate synthase I/II/III large subunit
MKPSVADSIALALRRHGITLIFGQSNPPSLLLAAERVGIRQLLYRTENAGGAMADGYARISGRIGVIAVQNGPAATLVVAPMSEALKASIPMLVLVQEVAANVRDRNAFQEFDHVALFCSSSKWTRRIDHSARVEDYVDLAITVATSGRPGPVVLLLPSDLLDMPAQPPRFERTACLGSYPLDRVRPDAGVVAEAAQLIAAASMPIIIAGGGVHISNAAAELEALQTTANLAVATTHMGKGAVSETAALSLGVAANITGRNGPAHYQLPLIAEADVVLMVGTRTNENGTDSWTLTPSGARYIHIDVDSLEVGRNYEAVRLVGDAKLALSDLTTALKSLDLAKRNAHRPHLIKRISEGRQRHHQTVAQRVASDEVPIAPERLMTELDALLTPDDIVVADASYASIWVTAYLTAKRSGQRFLAPRGQAGLGWGLPLGIGAKLARPNARVVAIVGDGGFAHVWAELETAVREKTPLLLVVLNNGLLGMQRHGENAVWGRTTTAINFNEVNHAAVAHAVGAVGVTVSHPREIRRALIAALDSKLPTLLDVIVDPKAYAPVRAWDLHSDRING